MKKMLILILIFISISLFGIRNNIGVVISNSVSGFKKDGNILPLYNGEFLKEVINLDTTEGSKGTSEYWEFWTDAYLYWELLWYYQKFSLYGNDALTDHIFVLYGHGQDEECNWIRYKAENHWLQGWSGDKITDGLPLKATKEGLDSLIRYLSEGDENYGYEPMDEDDYLYVLTHDHGTAGWTTHSVDITNLNSPQPLSYSFPNIFGYQIEVQGNYVYTVSMGNGFKGFLTITDATNPDELVERGVLDFGLGENAFSIEVSGNYAYVGLNNSGLKTVNISNPDAPYVVDTDNQNQITDFEICGNRLYAVSGGYSYLKIYDISNPGDPQQISSIYFNKTNRPMIGVRRGTTTDTCYLAIPQSVSSGFIGVISISEPEQVSYFNFSPPIFDVEVDSFYLYAGGDGFLKVLYRDELLSEISEILLEGCYTMEIKKYGNYLFVAGYDGGVYIVDVSNPYLPSLVSHYQPEGAYISGLAKQGNYLFLSGLGSNGDNSYLCLLDYVISDEDFSEKFSNVNAGKKVYWMQQCYSGGFIDDLSSDNTVILTSASGTELAWRADDIPWYNINQWQRDPNPIENWENYVVYGSENEIIGTDTVPHGEFSFHAMNVVRRETPYGSTYIGPSGYNDYLISMKEVYDYVDTFDSQKFRRKLYYCSGGNCYEYIKPPEHPQYSDIGNIGNNTFIGWDDGLAPDAPTGLTYNVTPYRPGVVNINLDWNDNTEQDRVAYNVYHRVPNGAWELLGKTRNSNYTHRVQSGSEHYYYVTCYDMLNQEGPASNVIYAIGIIIEPLKIGGSSDVVWRESIIRTEEGIALDFGDSLLYNINMENAKYIVYWTPEKKGNIYLDEELLNEESKTICNGVSIYKVKKFNGERIIKIKGNAKVTMGLIGIIKNDASSSIFDFEKFGIEERDVQPVSNVVFDRIILNKDNLRSEIELFDIQGRKIKEGVVEGEMMIKELPAGIYIMRINKEKIFKITVIR